MGEKLQTANTLVLYRTQRCVSDLEFLMIYVTPCCFRCIVMRSSFFVVFICIYILLFLCVTDSARILISEFKVQRSLETGITWRNFTHTTKRTEYRYGYRVVCKDGRYGPGCNFQCTPRDDKFGHYSCNNNGQKICLPGWKGDYCEEGTRKTKKFYKIYPISFINTLYPKTTTMHFKKHC